MARRLPDEKPAEAVEPEAVAPEVEAPEVPADEKPAEVVEKPSGRREKFEATRPDGIVVVIDRNIDTGEQTVTEKK